MAGGLQGGSNHFCSHLTRQLRGPNRSNSSPDAAKLPKLLSYPKCVIFVSLPPRSVPTPPAIGKPLRRGPSAGGELRPSHQRQRHRGGDGGTSWRRRPCQRRRRSVGWGRRGFGRGVATGDAVRGERRASRVRLCRRWTHLSGHRWCLCWCRAVHLLTGCSCSGVEGPCWYEISAPGTGSWCEMRRIEAPISYV